MNKKIKNKKSVRVRTKVAYRRIFHRIQNRAGERNWKNAQVPTFWCERERRQEYNRAFSGFSLLADSDSKKCFPFQFRPFSLNLIIAQWTLWTIKNTRTVTQSSTFRDSNSSPFWSTDNLYFSILHTSNVCLVLLKSSYLENNFVLSQSCSLASQSSSQTAKKDSVSISMFILYHVICWRIQWNSRYRSISIALTLSSPGSRQTIDFSIVFRCCVFTLCYSSVMFPFILTNTVIAFEAL